MYDLISREMKTLAGDYQILYFRTEKKRTKLPACKLELFNSLLLQPNNFITLIKLIKRFNERQKKETISNCH